MTLFEIEDGVVPPTLGIAGRKARLARDPRQVAKKEVHRRLDSRGGLGNTYGERSKFASDICVYFPCVDIGTVLRWIREWSASRDASPHI